MEQDVADWRVAGEEETSTLRSRSWPSHGMRDITHTRYRSQICHAHIVNTRNSNPSALDRTRGLVTFPVHNEVTCQWTPKMNGGGEGDANVKFELRGCAGGETDNSAGVDGITITVQKRYTAISESFRTSRVRDPVARCRPPRPWTVPRCQCVQVVSGSPLVLRLLWTKMDSG